MYNHQFSLNHEVSHKNKWCSNKIFELLKEVKTRVKSIDLCYWKTSTYICTRIPLNHRPSLFFKIIFQYNLWIVDFVQIRAQTGQPHFSAGSKLMQVFSSYKHYSNRIKSRKGFGALWFVHRTRHAMIVVIFIIKQLGRAWCVYVFVTGSF